MSVDRGALRGKTPRITWGLSYANTLNFSQPLDEATSYSAPRTDIETSDAMSGAGDGWSYGFVGLLTGVVRRIPRLDIGSVTGWEGATGWDAFLRAADDFGLLRFIPDVTVPGTYWTCYAQSWELVGEEINRMRMVRLTLRRQDLGLFLGY